MAEAPTTKARREQLRDTLKAKLDDRPTSDMSIDGAYRSSEEEFALNELMATLFRGRRGEDVLKYLASITIDRIGGPGVGPNALLHMEGSRYLYGIIKARVELGRDRK